MDEKPDHQREGWNKGEPQFPRINWTVFFWLFFLLFLLFGPLLSRPYGPEGTEVNYSTFYSTFRKQLESGNVADVTIQGEKISGKFKNSLEKRTPEQKTASYRKFYTYLPSFGDDKLLSMLEEQKVDIVTEPKKDASWWTGILLALLPFLVLIGIGLLVYRNSKGGSWQNVFSIGGNRARLYERRREGTTFNDVAGAHGAKTELREVVDFLKNSDKFARLGGKTPKGLLLVGPPGTGKTLLARAVAGEAEVPFFSITGSDFMEVFVGVGASRVRNLFNDAKKVAPSIIFIDEIDSIGIHRGAGIGGGHDEREQTLNQLLSELDGFEPNENVIVLAATNRPDILDPALLLKKAFGRAGDVLRRYRTGLDRLARRLVEKEEVSGKEMLELVKPPASQGTQTKPQPGQVHGAAVS